MDSTRCYRKETVVKRPANRNKPPLRAVFKKYMKAALVLAVLAATVWLAFKLYQ